jgi:hypothetical protein
MTMSGGEPEATREIAVVNGDLASVFSGITVQS